MNANTIAAENGILTLTPAQFAAKYLPTLEARGTQDETLTDYFVRNLDTDKLELHITKSTYRELDADTKQALWADFRWSKQSGCWIERAMPDRDYEALLIFARAIGLSDGGYFVTLTLDAPDASDAPDLPATREAETAKPPKPAPAKPAPKAKPEAKQDRTQTINAAPRVTAGSLDTDEIEHVLRRGSGFEGGKIRIAAFYAANHTPDEAKRFLREEYGTGGCSHTFLTGASGFVDYDASGIKVRFWKSEGEFKFSWLTVHAYLHDMIKNGRYLTEAEQAKYNELLRPYAKRKAPPTPAPRMHYPPEKASD